MRYFHVPKDQITGTSVRISGRELHHLVNVLRLREGDEITVLDGSGGVYEVLLTSCNRDAATGEIRDRWQARPPSVEIAVFVGLPKADKMDMIVQKATELGVSGIVPVVCRHSVLQLSAERTQQRVARWRQIAVEASKQSHRPFFPFVSDILSFEEAMENYQADLRLIFVARATRSIRGLKDVLKQNADARKVNIFIGPEGGLAEDEIHLALSAGAVPVSLGANVLRTETAAIAALAVVLYEYAGVSISVSTDF
jgi:16S rRNA (uracil1498-N3)-methyltransferase